ncbi:MAG: ribonuclease HII [Lachnospiraceae bacterium]|nr:ribonuclease HII [Lachnospiraceae bacterium]
MEKVSDILFQIKTADESLLPALLDKYEGDDRESVKKAVNSARKRLLKLEEEDLRLEGMMKYERKYPGLFICGIDEVGRGPLAGPVMAGAVILPEGEKIRYVNDSKKLSEKKREELCALIKEKAVAWNVSAVSQERIDEVNILNATKEAMITAVNSLVTKPDVLLIDALTLPIDIKQEGIVKGDMNSISIAAASIVAKVTRDDYMKKMALKYPEYGFDRNMGYGTAEHIAAIKKYGPCPIHRKSFIGNFI